MSYTCMLQKRFRDRTIRLCNVGSGSNVTVCLVCSDDFFRRHDRVNIVPLRFFVCQINSGTTVLYIMEETDDSLFMSFGVSFCKIRLFLLYVTGASLFFFIYTNPFDETHVDHNDSIIGSLLKYERGIWWQN